jgi:hypothetical protein
MLTLTTRFMPIFAIGGSSGTTLMVKPKEAPDRRCEHVAIAEEMVGVSYPLETAQRAMAVWGTYKDFRKRVAYVLTDDPALAIQMVKELGYFGLEWEAELVTLLPHAA